MDVTFMGPQFCHPGPKINRIHACPKLHWIVGTGASSQQIYFQQMRHALSFVGERFRLVVRMQWRVFLFYI
jgi:hypothetical protein